MPADLKDRLDTAAAENGRSLTGEIVYTLEKVYPPKDVIIESLRHATSLLRDLEGNEVVLKINKDELASTADRLEYLTDQIYKHLLQSPEEHKREALRIEMEYDAQIEALMKEKSDKLAEQKARMYGDPTHSESD